MGAALVLEAVPASESVLASAEGHAWVEDPVRMEDPACKGCP